MPAIGNITINDGAGTPVAHTFSPTAIDSAGVATYYDRSGGISIGYPKISLSLVQPSKTSKLFKARVKVVLPVLETQSGTASNGFTPAPQKAYDLTADMTFILPERSTLQNRKDLFAFAKNLLAQSVLTSLVESNEPVY